ncbi:hypothetical protein [Endozoicomonas sp. G2_1]|uniref:hypothetical protein n=1 Tax=Endozoicomonas sp. G2_1 TaxID=2821091 RepID=UPI001ADC4B14|nr:hypothetical protein [Endozoicomonas sp. G2_1]
MSERKLSDNIGKYGIKHKKAGRVFIIPASEIANFMHSDIEESKSTGMPKYKPVNFMNNH